MKLFNDPQWARYRIRNGIIHITLFRILEFTDRLEAYRYIKDHGLNTDIYYVEMR